MKDLFVLAADADALAVVRAVLRRFKALGIRSITFDVDRHTGRDVGMVKDGPELIRMKLGKTEFQKVVLLWDHKGSGWEQRSEEDARGRIQARLDQVTWEKRSAAVVVSPEIEEWIWHDVGAVASHLEVGGATLESWIEAFAKGRNLVGSASMKRQPKELFEYAMRQKYRRGLLPRDFECIAREADLAAWQASNSFARFVQILQQWFPLTSAKQR